MKKWRWSRWWHFRKTVNRMSWTVWHIFYCMNSGKKKSYFLLQSISETEHGIGHIRVSFIKIFYRDFDDDEYAVCVACSSMDSLLPNLWFFLLNCSFFCVCIQSICSRFSDFLHFYDVRWSSQSQWLLVKNPIVSSIEDSAVISFMLTDSFRL